MSEEAEKIVAWLRTDEFNSGCNYGKVIANRIERGDHLVWKPEPTISAAEWTKQSNVGH